MTIGNKVSAVTSRIKQLAGSSGRATPDQQRLPDVLEYTGFEGSVEDAEVIGRSPMAYVAASESVSSMLGQQTSRKLADYGVDDIDPDEWYPLAAPLAMLFEMQEEYGDGNIGMMGRNIPQHVEFPPGIETVEEALRSIDEAYHQNHRGGDIGSYEFHGEGPGEARMACENPYPCELDKGLIRGVAKAFTESPVHVEEVGDGCRQDGDTRCTYRVEWVES